MRPEPSAGRARTASAMLFLALGFSYGTWTARLPALKASLGLDASGVSLLLLAGALGAVFSFPVTAALLQRLGSRGACRLAGFALPGVLLALGAVPTRLGAEVVMFVFGITASALDVAMNAQGVEVERRFGRALMSRLHAMFSLGTMGGALFASLAVALSPSVPLHFAAAASVLAAGVAATQSGLLVDEHPIEPGSRRFALPRGGASWLGAIALVGAIAEGSMIDWSTLYMRESAGASPQVAPLGIASVQAAMLLARWFGDGWRMRLGARRLLMAGSLAAGTGLGLALLAGGVGPALAGFAVAGAGVAAVSPCVYAAGAREGAVALAAVTTMGSLGGLVGPPLIGTVAQHAGLPWGMAVVALGGFVMAALVRRVQWR